MGIETLCCQVLLTLAYCVEYFILVLSVSTHMRFEKPIWVRILLNNSCEEEADLWSYDMDNVLPQFCKC